MFKIILKLLKIRYWGVGFELDLPPEFVVTSHAQLRLSQRLRAKKEDQPNIVLRAYYEGEKPPKDFKPNSADRSKQYSRFQYKKYGEYIFVFGLRFSKNRAFPQKHLITIYNWH